MNEIFVTLGPAVHGYLRASGVHDSEDVLSEVFVRVARGFRRFRGGDAQLRSWVFTIAYHCLIDEHRRSLRERLLVKRAPVSSPAPPPGEPFDPALVNALGKLTPDQREVITLRFVADLPLEEVARMTNRPVGAVKSVQHRALRTLATLLSGQDQDCGAAP